MTLGVVASACAFNAAGQTAEPKEKDVIRLEEVTVTAQRREQSLQDVPISINVFSGEKLVEMKIDRFEDLVLQEPSLTLKAGMSPNALQFGMRGFSSLILGQGIQPAVSLVVDGVPLAMDSEFVMEFADIERIEILKGPQGTLFGGNAVGGLINLVRKRPQDVYDARVELDVSSDDERIYRIIAGGPISDNVAGRIFAYKKDKEGHIKNIFPGAKRAGSIDENGVVAKLSFAVSDTFDVLLTGEYRDFISYTGLVTTINDVPEREAAVGAHVIADPFLINQNQDAFGAVENWGITLEMSWELSETLSLTATSSYRDLLNLTTFDLDSSPASVTNRLDMPFVFFPDSNISNIDDDAGAQTAVIDTDYWTHELKFQNLTEDFDTVVGLYYRDFRQVSPTNVGLLVRGDTAAEEDILGVGFAPPLPTTSAHLALGIVSDADLQREEAAIYGDVTWHLASNFDVFGGLRYHRDKTSLGHTSRIAITPAAEPFFSSEPDTGIFNQILVDQVGAFDSSRLTEEWAARLGGSWFINSSSNIYATVSRGFIGTGVDASAVAVEGKEYLDPTTALSFELGFKSSFMDNRVVLNGAVFHQESQDVQISTIPPGEFQARARNIGNLESMGIELTLGLQATQNLSLNASLTALDTARRNITEACYHEQTEEEGCNLDIDDDGTPESQDVDGDPSIGTPDLAYTISARYEIPQITNSTRGFMATSWTWTDDVQFDLDGDPLTVQESYGLLDVAMGIEEVDGKYKLSLFGKNVMDTFFAGSKTSGVNILGRVAINTPAQAQFYWGMQAMYNF
nr:TonB-dependent receptor [Spongiibacter thalassae]